MDPEVINLTAFETYFEERRPFLVEGAQIFRNFGRGGGGGGQGGDGQQRRRSSTRGGSAARRKGGRRRVRRCPSATTILGAAKVTARRLAVEPWRARRGDRPRAARVDDAGVRSRVEVEPLTNYLWRALRESGAAASGFSDGHVAEPAHGGADRAAPAAVGRGRRRWYYFLDAGREWLVSGQAS